MAKTVARDISLLVDKSTTPHLIDILPEVTPNTHASISSTILGRTKYSKTVLGRLGKETIDHFDNEKSPYKGIVDEKVLDEFIGEYLTYIPGLARYSPHAFMFMPDDYLELIKKVAGALSTLQQTPQKVLIGSIENTLSIYSRFLDETYDTEGEESPWKETEERFSRRDNAEASHKNYISIECSKQESRDNLDWQRFGDELCDYVETIVGNPFLAKNSILVDGAKKLLQKIKNHKKDPIPESIVARATTLLEGQAFNSAEELKKKKAQLIGLFQRNTSEKNIEKITVNKFASIFNKACEFSQNFENNPDPLASSNIGKEFQDFADKCLSKFAADFATSSQTPEENEDLSKLCELIKGNETLASSFLQKYSAIHGVKMPAIAKVAQALTPEHP